MPGASPIRTTGAEPSSNRWPGRANDVLAIYRAFIERYSDALGAFSDAELLIAARLLQAFCDRSENPSAPLRCDPRGMP